MNIQHPLNMVLMQAWLFLIFYLKKKPDPVLSFVTASEYKTLYLLN
ncbi:hypothetical protein SAMN03003324_04034 [Pedobacter antarcticus]|uniref:Uncharacterized protein n=1 Tax=Pedobacter antarcticus TaxID=34086 RepID=A0A1I2IVZ5_9SPHI|nr:hypothetical protein SAMN03003324_04034 [Pedobacter antarcticus]